MSRWLRLGVYHTVTGQHAGAWRVSTQATDPESLEQHVAAARTAQDAGFDFLLVTDVLGEQGDPHGPEPVRAGFQPRLEPGVLLSALAAATRDIGLVGSFSTTFEDPYPLARRLASLDHVSGGRAGWNVVTSFQALAAAASGGERLPAHADRYARAREVLAAAYELWDAWAPDAVVRDRRSGRYVEPARVRRVEHVTGAHDVRAVLPSSRSPQGELRGEARGLLGRRVGRDEQQCGVARRVHREEHERDGPPHGEQPREQSPAQVAPADRWSQASGEEDGALTGTRGRGGSSGDDGHGYSRKGRGVGWCGNVP
ncbi:LLM class flavin-dependent oxidoreductase [Cellulomonas persica]|uniref:Luciferase-like domain-containing protein n=1 Tax=Cellulomonas persica TaxID=76861 RepID=A0A510UTI9_9CELL|nr:LLM class flavin-dependent oxidoreductase [Cellulomonas persica]GEK17879.1 hypothetical protein CPE01_16120 [Cellulomonas persica]